MPNCSGEVLLFAQPIEDFAHMCDKALGLSKWRGFFALGGGSLLLLLCFLLCGIRCACARQRRKAFALGQQYAEQLERNGGKDSKHSLSDSVPSKQVSYPVARVVKPAQQLQQVTFVPGIDKEKFINARDKNEYYTVKSKLGAGAFGAVFHVVRGDIIERKEGEEENERTKQKSFALKIIFDMSSYREEEVRVLSELKHPNIVRFEKQFEVFSTSKQQKLPCILMEYVDGTSMRDVLSRHALKEAGMELFMKWFLDLLAAIEHMHSKNVLHRDLKPDNIILEKVENGPPRIKIVDFGIALRSTATGTIASAQTISVAGTLLYLPPEVIHMAVSGGKNAYSGKTDVWALGCILFETLSGQFLIKDPIKELASDDLWNVVNQRIDSLPEKMDVTGCVKKLLKKMICRVEQRKQAAELLRDDILRGFSVALDPSSNKRDECPSTVDFLSPFVTVVSDPNCAKNLRVKNMSYLLKHSEVTGVREVLLRLRFIKGIVYILLTDEGDSESAASLMLKVQFLLAVAGMADADLDPAGKLALMQMIAGALETDTSLQEELMKLLLYLCTTDPFSQQFLKQICYYPDLLACLVERVLNDKGKYNSKDLKYAAALLNLLLRYKESRKMIFQFMDFGFFAQGCAQVVGMDIIYVILLQDVWWTLSPEQGMRFLRFINNFCDSETAFSILRSFIVSSRYVMPALESSSPFANFFSQVISRFAVQNHTTDRAVPIINAALSLCLDQEELERAVQCCNNNDMCTQLITGPALEIRQIRFYCNDCSKDNSRVEPCLACLRQCHRGHKLILLTGGIAYGRCTCANSSCIARSYHSGPEWMHLLATEDGKNGAEYEALLLPPPALDIQNASSRIAPDFFKFGKNYLTAQHLFRVFPKEEKEGEYSNTQSLGFDFEPDRERREGSVFYFEIECITFKPLSHRGNVGMGLAPANPSGKGGMVGLESGEYGYHSDDGKCFEGDGKGSCHPAIPWAAGIRVGCGMTSSGDVYFTQDGVYLHTCSKPAASNTFYATVTTTDLLCDIQFYFLPSAWRFQPEEISKLVDESWLANLKNLANPSGIKVAFGCISQQPQSDQKSASVCPKGHRLKSFRTPNTSFHCDVCGKDQANNTPMHGCRDCNYDMCQSCHQKAQGGPTRLSELKSPVKPEDAKMAQKGFMFDLAAHKPVRIAAFSGGGDRFDNNVTVFTTRDGGPAGDQKSDIDNWVQVGSGSWDKDKTTRLELDGKGVPINSGQRRGFFIHTHEQGINLGSRKENTATPTVSHRNTDLSVYTGFCTMGEFGGVTNRMFEFCGNIEYATCSTAEAQSPVEAQPDVTSWSEVGRALASAPELAVLVLWCLHVVPILRPLLTTGPEFRALMGAITKYQRSLSPFAQGLVEQLQDPSVTAGDRAAQRPLRHELLAPKTKPVFLRRRNSMDDSVNDIQVNSKEAQNAPEASPANVESKQKASPAPTSFQPALVADSLNPYKAGMSFMQDSSRVEAKKDDGKVNGRDKGASAAQSMPMNGMDPNMMFHLLNLMPMFYGSVPNQGAAPGMPMPMVPPQSSNKPIKLRVRVADIPSKVHLTALEPGQQTMAALQRMLVQDVFKDKLECSEMCLIEKLHGDEYVEVHNDNQVRLLEDDDELRVHLNPELLPGFRRTTNLSVGSVSPAARSVSITIASINAEDDSADVPQDGEASEHRDDDTIEV